jgi:hypothetical protein
VFVANMTGNVVVLGFSVDPRSRRMLSSFAAGSACVSAASVQLDYLRAGIRGLRSAPEDDDC